MDRVLMSVAVLALATLPVGTVSAEREAEEGRCFDLTGDLAADTVSIGTWANRHGADLWLCSSGGEAPARAMLGKIRAGALVLTRDAATAEPSSKIFRAGDNALLLDTTRLGLGASTGLDVTLLTTLGPTNELEVRFFGIDGWNASRTASDPQEVRFEGFGIIAAAQSERIDYASRLYNVEVNVRPRVAEGVPLILGFRSLQLHERFELSRLDPQPAAVLLGARTTNYLYGFQVGAEPYLLGGDRPLRLEGLIKAGIYANYASQGTFSPLSDTSVDARQFRTSFAGELGLTVEYQFCPSFAARIGYELLWLHGVALAPDQSASTNLLAPSAAVHSSASALYQGGTATLEFIF